VVTDAVAAALCIDTVQNQPRSNSLLLLLLPLLLLTSLAAKMLQ
jgi:hypothetical protein